MGGRGGSSCSGGSKVDLPFNVELIFNCGAEAMREDLRGMCQISKEKGRDDVPMVAEPCKDIGG